MAPSIGLNLRVTGYKHQGGRKYMEDEFGVAYQQTADEKDLEYAFFGIFDGHGGREAALFAKVGFLSARITYCRASQCMVNTQKLYFLLGTKPYFAFELNARSRIFGTANPWFHHAQFT